MPGREVTLPALRQRSNGRSGPNGKPSTCFIANLCASSALREIVFRPLHADSRRVATCAMAILAMHCEERGRSSPARAGCPCHGSHERISRTVLVSRAEPQRRRVSTARATPKANTCAVSVRISAAYRLCARLAFVPYMLTTGELRLMPWLSWPCTGTSVDDRPRHGQDARGTAAMKEFLERF